MRSFSSFFLLSLFFHISYVLGVHKWEVLARPAKGKSGVLTNGNVIEVYYGDDVWWHAKHTVDEGWAGKLFSFAATKDEHDENRKIATKATLTGSQINKSGLARDEKPCAIMHYRPTKKATVWMLPGDESISRCPSPFDVMKLTKLIVEGHLEGEALIQGGDYGTKKQVKMIDNRTSATTPPISRAPSPVAGAKKKPKRSIEELTLVIRHAQEEIEAINLAKRDKLLAREMRLIHGLNTLARRSTFLDTRVAEPEFADLDNIYARDPFDESVGFDGFDFYARDVEMEDLMARDSGFVW